METREAKKRLVVFLKAGLPFTIIGMVLVLGGLWVLKYLFHGSEYLSLLLFAWLAVFWFIYQPLFRKRIQKVKGQLS